VACDPVDVPLEDAVPLGLLLNEALTNAFKYGLRGDARATPGHRCDVRVELTRRDRELSLVVADWGPGLPPGFDPAATRSLGMRLVHSLARQLRGRLELESDGGLRLRLHCTVAG
jgi:two-component sensor histidine kinase